MIGIDDVELTLYEMLIANEWVASGAGGRMKCVNPFDGRTWAEVPAADDSDVDRAVNAARRAFDSPEWREAAPSYRAGLLRRLAGLIEDNAQLLAEIQVRENGKLLRELLGQARVMADHCHFYAGLAELTHGTSPSVSIPDMVVYTQREPIGVVAAITPWNSPLLLMLWKVGPALAAGNTVVIKPSEITPVSTLVFGGLAIQAGFPAGVINILTGPGSVGRALVRHPGVDRIAFTGSTATGKDIASAAGARLARISLELGGKSPNIIFSDADIKEAVNGVLAGIFGATGQSCMAGARILIEEQIYDEVAEAIVRGANAIRLGDPMAPATEMGTVAFKGQYEKVLAFIELAKQEGATLLCGGKRATGPSLDRGLFVEPTVFGDVDNTMRIAREEVFGPVACLLKFRNEDEAVAIANDTPFGLAAGIWTRDVARAHRMARSLRAGTVWINTYRRTNYVVPFGGYRESGVGRENGLDALNEYTEVKSVWINTGGIIKDPFNPRA